MNNPLLESIEKIFKSFESYMSICQDLIDVSQKQNTAISALTEEVTKMNNRIIFLEKLDKNKIYIS